jgi:two-component system, chemotaxis family, sensor kinase CheA
VQSDSLSESTILNLSKAAEIIGQLGEELAFVAPNQDAGLLPINRFVMDLEELAERDVPPSVTAGLKVARVWLDQTLDGPGKFTEESIRNFNGWHTWMTSVLLAWERGTAMPAWPEGWDGNHRAVAGAEGAKSTATPVPSGAEEPSIRLNLAEDLEFLREFHGESVELLHDIEQGVLVLEDNPTDVVTINSIFRAFHTFKGGAGFLHLEALRALAHDLESLLDAVRRSELRITSEVIDLILAGADALKHFTREIGAQLQGSNPGAPILVPTRQIIGRVQSALRGEPPPATAPPAVAAPPEASKAAAAPSAPTVETSDPTAEPKVRPTRAGAPRESVATGPSSGFVRLDTAKLDNLVDIVGELVIAQSMVVQNPDVQKINSLQLVRRLRQLSRITTELQRNAMSLRMVPIRAMFHKMNRLVRDLAVQQQKQVQLVLEGEETELDRNIVEKLGDPLVHMIRNTVDHGIEHPADRVAKGKPDLGTIRLVASHQRGGIVIRIQDDGRGLDRGRILAKAIDRGLVNANSNLTESETFSLIFLPGFSTAEKVTDLSGRGVGMDVVRRNIESLRGKIEIQSLPGQGTTFTILLPLTLAIIDGLLVGVGSDRYIIPTLSIRESFRPRPGMVTTVHEQGEMVSVRGRQTPLLRLGRYLGTTSRVVKPEDGIIVVVESGDSARGLLVDELIGKQEVVIKSLGGVFEQQNLLAGGAVLGDGWVGLILDIDTLVKMPYQPLAAEPPTSTAIV